MRKEAKTNSGINKNLGEFCRLVNTFHFQFFLLCKKASKLTIILPRYESVEVIYVGVQGKKEE
jgi:hypothetical protein